LLSGPHVQVNSFAALKRQNHSCRYRVYPTAP
jgi:hypothetical protein